MSEPTTSRPRPRAFWADLRFLLGIALIVTSVAGVWLVVATARQTTPVVAAARTLVPGEVVEAGDLRVVDVALGSVEEAYASPGSISPGTVAMRTISAGELVPSDAVGDASHLRVTRVVVHSTTVIPAAVAPGATVEIWASAQPERGVFEKPRVLVPAATVVTVSRETSVVSSSAVAVELVIERARVSDVLEAITGGAALSIVPAIGAIP